MENKAIVILFQVVVQLLSVLVLKIKSSRNNIYNSMYIHFQKQVSLSHYLPSILVSKFRVCDVDSRIHCWNVLLGNILNSGHSIS